MGKTALGYKMTARSTPGSGKVLKSIFHSLLVLTVVVLVYYVPWKTQSKELATKNNLGKRYMQKISAKGYT